MLQGKTPHEVWSRKMPDLSHLRVFGCKALAHIPKELRRRWDEKGKPCLFMRYLEHTKGYRLYDEEQQKIFRSRDVVFYEDATTSAVNKEMIQEVSLNSEDEEDRIDLSDDNSSNLEEDFETPEERQTEDKEERSENNEIIELSEDDDLDPDQLPHEEKEVVVPRRSSRTIKPTK